MSAYRVERLEERYLLSVNPSNLEAAPISDHQIELRWTTAAQSNPTGLWVQRAQGDADFQTVTGVLSTTPLYTDTNLSPNTTYRYQIWEQNPDGSSDYSNVASAATTPPQLSRQVIDLGRDPVAVSSYASPQVVIGGVGYFIFAPAGAQGPQLWRTDGTDAGTTVVKTFTGTGSSPYIQMIQVNDTLYLLVEGIAGSNGIWKSDGTQDGTVFVTNAGLDPSKTYIDRMIDFDGILYFTTQTSFGSALSLWRTDGTPAGSTLVKTFDTPPGTSDNLGVADGKLFLSESNGGTTGLWASDGTTAGTAPVVPPTNGNPSGAMQFFGTADRLYFTAGDGSASNPSLWTSDGTAAGTVRLLSGFGADLRNGLDPAMLGSNLYFLAYSGATPTLHLWKTDGTAAGTQPVADLQQAVSSVGYSGQYHVHVVGGRLLFGTDSGSNAILWSSDGTSGGTTPILQIPLDSQTTVGVRYLTDFAGTVYFAAPTPGGGGALWRTDGTAAGTTQIVGLAGPPQNLRQLGNLLTFSGFDPVHGYEFWASDGTAAGTHLVRNFAPDTTAPRRLTYLTSADGSLLFGTTNPGSTGTREVWKSDGTQAGTVELANASLSFLGSADGTWFFSNGQIWVSDQTPAGTHAITGQLLPAGLGTAGHKLFFATGQYGAPSDALWVSDGTAAGTMQIGTQTVYPSQGYYGSAGDYFYFTPSQPGTGSDLGVYRTDGTVGGTIKLTDATPIYQTLTDVNGTMFFLGYDAVNGQGLWRSDGTPQGTVFLHHFRNAYSLASVDGLLYFVADDAGGYFLWSSDGTPGGTQSIPAVPLPNQTGLAGGGNGIIYMVENGNTELWRTDHTAQGTFLLHTRQATVGYIRSVIALGNLEYFTDGQSLWVTDGIAWGTRQIDVSPPGGFSLVNRLAAPNGKLYLGGAADDASSSDTIRVVDTTAPAPPTGLTATSTPATGAAPAGVRLTWADPAGNNEAGFIIERSLHPDFSTIDANFYSPQSVTAFTDSQVSAAANYYYRVRAINATGTSVASTDASASFAVIRGSVFYDANYNGVRDSGERPMAGVTVFIDANANGILDAGEIHTVTGADGQFTLGGLAGGGYLVREVVPSGDRRTTRVSQDPPLSAVGHEITGVDFGNVALADVHLDFSYLLRIAQHFGQMGTIAQGDLTGDEHVNFDDLLLLAQHYNGTLPAVRSAAARR